jgi:protein arginine N-methyltransferase 1
MSAEPKLSDTTVLRRARNLRLRIDSDEVVYVVKHGGVVSCGHRGLAILDAFARPTSLRDAVASLADSDSAQEWMEVTGTIVGLHRSGVLVEEHEDGEGRAVSDGSFADPLMQTMMLNDRARTHAFVEAIRATVTPDDVVVDIGTGSGVLAVAAALAGARHVYAIEATGIARAARAVFRANDVADRVTLLEGWSTEVDLPEPASLLVSEIIGEMPLDEHVLETTLDARRRLLRPDAGLIPSRLRLVGTPLAIPPDRLASRTADAGTVERWRDWYGVDLSPIAEAAHGLGHMIFLDRESAAEIPAIADPVLLADIDLSTFEQLQVNADAETAVRRSGRLNGVLISFEIALSEGVELSSRPDIADPGTSWRNVAWFFNDPIDVADGERVSVAFRYRVPGERNGVFVRRSQA